MRGRWLAALLLIAILFVTACGRLPTADSNPGVDLSDPDVGGGAGVETGPQTPIPTPLPTNEASPRLDETAQALATYPPASPTLAPTVGLPPPATETPVPAEAIAPAATETPQPPAETTPEEPQPSPTPEGGLNEQGEIVHTVQPGENLFRIGLIYGVSWVAIAEFNAITNPDAIAEGQEIRIPPTPQPTLTAAATTESRSPAAEPVAAAPLEAVLAQGTPAPVAADEDMPAEVAVELSAPAIEDTHTVRTGDTLFAIARSYGVSWELVAEANGLAALNQIYAGQVLKIPTEIPGPAHEFAHQVHRGETLAGIARQYGLTVQELAEANGLAQPFVIHPGQTITIPGEE